MTALAALPVRDNRVFIPALSRPPVAASGCVRHGLAGRAFATGWNVTVYAQPGVDMVGLRARIEACLAQIDAEMSPYRADSDLTRFNTAPDGAYVPLPPMILQVIRQALGVAHVTDGAYDPALLEAVELWGFGAQAVSEGLPETGTIEALKRRSGDWRALNWTPQGLMKPARVKLDLCGIAKGYAVDCVTQILKTTPGVGAALVEIGGELKGFGVRDDGLPFWVEIEGADNTLIALCDLAVATSGNGQRFFVHEGAVLSHTIDSKTQSPTRSDLAAVTVFDAAAWRADALATALMVMGSTVGLKFAASLDIPCLMRLNGGTERISPVLEGWL